MVIPAEMNSSTISALSRNFSVFNGDTSKALTPSRLSFSASPFSFRNTGLPMRYEPFISFPSEMKAWREYFLSLTAVMLLAMLMPPALVP